MKRQRGNAVNSLHARLLLLSRGHVSNRDIAARVGYSPQWVSILIQRFNDQGIDGVLWYPYWQVRGTPQKFLADNREQIAEVALSSPKSLIGMNRWSLPKLRTSPSSDQERDAHKAQADKLERLIKRYFDGLRGNKWLAQLAPGGIGLLRMTGSDVVHALENESL